MYLAKHIAAFTNFFGMQDPDFIMSFATIPWQSEKDRNGFLNELSYMNNGDIFRQENKNVR